MVPALLKNSEAQFITKLDAATEQNQTADEVVALWVEICNLHFKDADSLLGQDGVEIPTFRIVSIKDTTAVQRVVVYESEVQDENFVEGIPFYYRYFDEEENPRMDEVMDPELQYRRHVKVGGLQRTSKGNFLKYNEDRDGVWFIPQREIPAAESELRTTYRDIAILIIECRAANTDEPDEFRIPGTTGPSRSLPNDHPPSDIQGTLLEFCNHLETNVGGKTQDQVLCATAIGEKVRFWKKGREFPQLYQWGPILDLTELEHRCVVEDRIMQARESGYEFAMEFPES